MDVQVPRIKGDSKYIQKTSVPLPYTLFKSSLGHKYHVNALLLHCIV
jgi:hypothetical protein